MANAGSGSRGPDSGEDTLVGGAECCWDRDSLGMFVFFGAVSHSTLLTLLTVGAGVGAAMGSWSFGGWLKIDWVPPAVILLAKLMVLVLAGIVGAWGGYQFGASQEVECCVGPAITPITYTALGATAATNAAALVMGVADEIKVRGGWAKLRAAAGSTLGSRGEAGRFSRQIRRFALSCPGKLAGANWHEGHTPD